jgi:hypothetical protein
MGQTVQPSQIGPSEAVDANGIILERRRAPRGTNGFSLLNRTMTFEADSPAPTTNPAPDLTTGSSATRSGQPSFAPAPAPRFETHDPPETDPAAPAGSVAGAFPDPAGPDPHVGDATYPAPLDTADAPPMTFAEMVRVSNEVGLEEAPKPQNWFLEAGAFGTSASATTTAAAAPESMPTPEESKASRDAAKKLKPDQVKPAKVKPAKAKADKVMQDTVDKDISGKASRRGPQSLVYGVLLIVVLGIAGGMAKMTVLSGKGGAKNDIPATLALGGKHLDCPGTPSKRPVRRYEQQTITEDWRGARNEQRSRIRFVDNEADNYIERLEQAKDADDILVGGHRYDSTSGAWVDTELNAQQAVQAVSVPFLDRFADTRLLNGSSLDGQAVCFFTGTLGDVTTADGRPLANAQLELYVDAAGNYRRMRVRGEAGAAPTGDAAAGAPVSYVLTVDFADAPAFVPNPPTKLATSF